MLDNQVTDLLTRAQAGIEEILSPEESGGDDANDQEQLELRIEFGRTRLQADNLQELRSGSVVALDEPAGELVAIYAGDRLIGRGEVVAVDGKIGVRVTQLTET
jgi:flagellar motor switch protein FliN